MFEIIQLDVFTNSTPPKEQPRGDRTSDEDQRLAWRAMHWLRRKRKDVGTVPRFLGTNPRNLLLPRHPLRLLNRLDCAVPMTRHHQTFDISFPYTFEQMRYLPVLRRLLPLVGTIRVKYVIKRKKGVHLLAGRVGIYARLAPKNTWEQR